MIPKFIHFLFINILILSNLSVITKCDPSDNVPKQSIRSVDLKKTQVYGPGLQPDKIVLPVRHFYILPKDAYGNR